MGRGNFRSLHRLDPEWTELFRNHLFLRNLSCGIADKRDPRWTSCVPAFPMRVHAWYFSIAERSLSGIACMIPIQRMLVDRRGESIGAIDRFLLQIALQVIRLEFGEIEIAFYFKNGSWFNGDLSRSLDGLEM